MRFLNGVVVGFVLAIGVAYWHDSAVSTTPDGPARTLVNWSEFGRSASAVGDWIATQLAQLAESLHHRG